MAYATNKTIPVTAVNEQERALPDSPAEFVKPGQEAARKINALPQIPRLAVVLALVFENIQLTAEVNELRSMLGIKPIPSYIPGSKQPWTKKQQGL